MGKLPLDMSNTDGKLHRIAKNSKPIVYQTITEHLVGRTTSGLIWEDHMQSIYTPTTRRTNSHHASVYHKTNILLLETAHNTKRKSNPCLSDWQLKKLEAISKKETNNTSNDRCNGKKINERSGLTKSFSHNTRLCDLDLALPYTRPVNITKQVGIPWLPAPPYPVDPYHFHCIKNTAPSTFITQLSSYLHYCDVQFTFEAKKSKFRCNKYINYTLLEFVVRVFQTQNSERVQVLLVECQRRSGCVLLWDKFYGTLYHVLKEKTGSVDVLASPSQQSRGQKKGRHDTESSTTSLNDKETKTENFQSISRLEALGTMIASKYIDTQREACKCLAAITEKEVTALQILKRPEIILAIMELLQDPYKDFEVTHSAMSVLANIAALVKSIRKVDHTAFDQFRQGIPIAQAILLYNDSQLEAQQFGCKKNLPLVSKKIFILPLFKECLRALVNLCRIWPEDIYVYKIILMLNRLKTDTCIDIIDDCLQALEIITAIK